MKYGQPVAKVQGAMLTRVFVKEGEPWPDPCHFLGFGRGGPFKLPYDHNRNYSLWHHVGNLARGRWVLVLETKENELGEVCP